MRITVSHTIHPVVQTPTGFTVTVERHIQANGDEESAVIGPAYTRPARRSQRGLGLRPPGVRGTHTRGARVAGEAARSRSRGKQWRNLDDLLDAIDDDRDECREHVRALEFQLRERAAERDKWRERAELAEAELLTTVEGDSDAVLKRVEELEFKLRTMEEDRDSWRERADRAEAELDAAIADRDEWRERAGGRGAALAAERELRKQAVRAAAAAETELGVATAELDKLRERDEELEAKPNARDGFVGELTSVLNRHSRENGSGTPDFILAEFLSGCLTEFNGAVNRREAWYGRERARFGTRFEVDREGQA